MYGHGVARAVIVTGDHLKILEPQSIGRPVLFLGTHEHDRGHRLGDASRGNQARLAPAQERDGELARWHAERKAGPAFVTALIWMAALAVWGLYHAWQFLEASEGEREPFAWAYDVVFVLLAWQMIAACMERPIRGRRGTGRLMR